MKNLFITLSCLLSIAGIYHVVDATNYCSSSICPSGVTHIACNNNGGFSSSCPANAKVVTLTAAQRKLIIQSHNLKRNQLAGGNVNGFKPASKMATMQWNAELATLAVLNAKQCIMQHDKCHNTDKFKASGQNLAVYSYTGAASAKTDDSLLTSSINSWWNEYKDTTQAYLNKYPSNYNGPAIGHFTVMARDSNTHVGCAAVRFAKDNWNNFLLACNYATTNWVSQPIYARGVAASKCSAVNKNLKNLCSVAEVYKDL